MHDPFSIMLSSVTLAPRFIWDLARVGVLRMRLQKELGDLRELREIRDNQFEILRYGAGRTLVVELASRPTSFNLARELTEPFLGIRMHLFNGSVFTIELKDLRCEALLKGRPLTLPSTLRNNLSHLGPGQIASLDFTQPIQDATREMLLGAIERHEHITWKFNVSATYLLPNLKQPGTLSQQLDYFEIPFNP